MFGNAQNAPDGVSKSGVQLLRPLIPDEGGDHSEQLNDCIQCQYYTPHRFHEFKNTLDKDRSECSFSVFHHNIRSIRRNIDNLRTHLLNELDFNFSVIGLTETKILITNDNFDQDIPEFKGYKFEHVPTPLVSGGVGMYIDETLNYMVLEKISSEGIVDRN